MSRKLFIDIETRSKVDLKKAGHRRYAVDPSTRITTAAWQWAAGGPICTACNIPGLERLGTHTMADFMQALRDADHIVAHNIGFDANVIFNTLGPCGLDLEKLDCTMARAQRVSLPGGLDELCGALNVPGKSMDGHRLVMATCKPRKDGTFNEDEAIFRQLLAYNVQDIRCLVNVDGMLPALPPSELEIWRRTWRKNARGLPLDIELCERIAAKRAEIEVEVANQLRELTQGGVTAITQRARIQEWLNSRGVKIPNMQRATIESWLDIEDMPLDAYIVLNIVFDSGGSAPTKAQTLLDRQVGGYFQDATRYFGARSGRGTSEGCFGAGTLVLTQVGWKPIVEVLTTDLTWDGETWNTHNGLIFQGVKKTIQMCGLTVTADHMVFCGRRWSSTLELRQKPWLRFLALATGLGSLWSLVTSSAPVTHELFLGVTAEHLNAPSDPPISESTGAARASRAQQNSMANCYVKNGGTTILQIVRSRAAYFGLSLASTIAAPTQKPKNGLLTEAVGSWSLLSGSPACRAASSKLAKSWAHSAAGLFYRIFSHLKVITLQVCNLTVSTMTEVMNRAIFVSSVAKKMQETGVRQQPSKKIACCSEVYDLSDCGPKNRYMILSSGGPLLVHNCNVFNIARPSGKYDPAFVIDSLKINPNQRFTNTELSDVLRGSIVAPPGDLLIDADLSNIELRLSLWFAGDHQKLALLAQDKDLYAATAGEAMGIPGLTKKTHSKERQAYKKVVLSGGYAIGVDRLYIAFKIDKDLPYEYRRDLTKAQVAAIHAGYRDTNAPLQMVWKSLDEAARAALRNRGVRIPVCDGKLEFHWRKDVDILELRLPSGRTIPHYKPRISDEGDLTFWRARYGRMLESRAFGGSWLEIACQSTARDILTGVESAVEAELPDVRLILDIYDSVVALAPAAVAEQRMEQILEIMRRVPAWAAGLPLNGEAYCASRMQK